jgi:hypothetical protein
MGVPQLLPAGHGTWASTRRLGGVMDGKETETERERLRATIKFFKHFKELRKKLQRDQLEWTTKNQNHTTKKNGK